MIHLRNVEKHYDTRGGRAFVLRQITLNIERGEFLTVMGPSGAGKTTLLNIIGLLDGEFSGHYFLGGKAVHELSAKERMSLSREYVGFIFQHFHLLDDLTVAENLDVPLSYRAIKRSQRQAMVAEVLDRFQIVAKKDLFPSQLSGGQQQLVAVARAVVAEPKLILADEPTGALHSSQGKMIMDLLRELNAQGATIIQVTHNEGWAAYGSRIIELLDGWMRREG